MKRLIWMTALLMLAGFAQAQGRPGAEKVKSAHIAFLTEALDLSPQEAEKFWPLYNQYQQERKSIREADKQNRAATGSWENLSENEAKILLDKKFIRQQRDLELKMRYKDEFLKVLPARKVLRLFAADREFRMRVSQTRKQHK